MMKVKYIGKTAALELTEGKIYLVHSVDKGWFRITNDMEDYPDDELPGYLYPPQLFEVIQE